MTRKKRHYLYLREHYFSPYEARELSVLPKASYALRRIVKDRAAQRKRFDAMADRKIDRGSWLPRDVAGKWRESLSKSYSRRGWRVKRGPVGKQPSRSKGLPNVWAMYRTYEKHMPDKGYISPWEIRQISRGKTKFDRGQIFIQKAEKGAQKSAIQGWIAQLTESIKLFPKQAEQFSKQRAALRKML